VVEPDAADRQPQHLAPAPAVGVQDHRFSRCAAPRSGLPAADLADDAALCCGW
jgi:hypothetical protein